MPRTGGRRARAHPVRPSINNQFHTSEKKRESNSRIRLLFWLVGWDAMDRVFNHSNFATDGMDAHASTKAAPS